MATATAAATACGGGGDLGAINPATAAGWPATDFGNANAGSGSQTNTLLDGGFAGPGSSDDPLTEDNACAAAALAAEQVMVEQEVEVEVEVPVEKEVQVEVSVDVEVKAPVAMYVMFDKSMSMGIGGRWTPAVNAMTGFLQSESSAGIDVALQYFPIGGGSCSTGAGYSTPVMSVGRLPDQAASLVSSLLGQSANGSGTPIEGACAASPSTAKRSNRSTPTSIAWRCS